MNRRKFIKQGALFVAAPMLWLPRKTSAQGLLQLAGPPPAAGGGPTYIVDEGFEGTGPPSGWYRSGGDFDDTAGPLAGAQSFSLFTNGEYAGISDGGVLNHGEVWGKFLFKPVALPASFVTFFRLVDAGFTGVLELTIFSTGVLNVAGGGIYLTTTDAMTAGTLYRVYFHYKKGSGANGVAECGFATADARPTTGNKFAGASNGSQTTNDSQTQHATADGADLTFDNVQLAATTFD